MISRNVLSHSGPFVQAVPQYSFCSFFHSFKQRVLLSRSTRTNERGQPHMNDKFSTVVKPDLPFDRWKEEQ